MNSVKTSSSIRNSGIRAFVLVFAFLASSLFLNAQSPSLSLGNVGVCSNTTVLVPLTGNNLTNIGAITLFIYYDDQSLAFSSIENIDPQMNGLMVNTMPNPARIAIVWTKTNGVTFMNTTLLNIKFDVLQKSGTLRFAKDSCEIANISLPPQIIPVSYTNGSIFAAKPSISSEPESKTVLSQSNVDFQVASPNASDYAWQESRNGGILWSDLSESITYHGTQTNNLTIKQVPVNFNQFWYRCVLNPNSCLAVSSAAILSVDSLTGMTEKPSHGILHLTNSPNPFADKTTLEYTVPEYGHVTIKIFSEPGIALGTPVNRLQEAGTYRIENNFVYLPTGIYFYQYVFKGTAGVYETCRKIIKIN